MDGLIAAGNLMAENKEFWINNSVFYEKFGSDAPILTALAHQVSEVSAGAQ